MSALTQAQRELVETWREDARRMALSYVGRFCRDGGDNARDEAISAAYEALCECSRKFDPSRGEFKPFMSFTVWRSLQRWCWEDSAVPTSFLNVARHRTRTEVISFDAPVGDGGRSRHEVLGTEEDHHGAWQAKHDIEAVWTWLESKCAGKRGGKRGGKRKAAIWFAVDVQGRTLDAVGIEHGISRERARQICNETREFITKFWPGLKEAA